MTWVLKHVLIKDLFGFAGEHRFPSGEEAFYLGATVYHMPNHTGKSSLANSIHWALTGIVGNPESVGKPQFSIHNAHSGDQGEPTVILTLIELQTDREMTITRKGAKEPSVTQKDNNPDLLVVELDDSVEFGWDEGQSLIESKLGLKTSSLSKCGVVRHSDMTRFVAGDSSIVASVMNDLLGLGPGLVEIAPILLAGKKEADGARKRVDAILKNENPIDQWNQRNSEIQDELSTLKDGLQNEGFSMEDVSGGGITSEAIEIRLTELEQSLEETQPEQELEDRLESIQNLILRKASSDPTSDDFREIVQERQRLQNWMDDSVGLVHEIEELQERYDSIVGEGRIDLSGAAEKMADAKKASESTENLINSIKSSSELAGVILHHLDVHDVESCPVCGSESQNEDIRRVASELLGPEIVARLVELESELENCNSILESSETSFKEVSELHQDISTLHPRYSEFIDGLDGVIEINKQSREHILSGEVSLKTICDQMRIGETELEGRVDELDLEETQLTELRDEYQTGTIQPLQDQLRDVQKLMAIVEQEEQLTLHRERRDEYKSRAADYLSKLNNARGLKTMLHNLHAALVGSQEEEARDAVQDALPLVNEVYSEVCTNPEFNRLHIDVNLKQHQSSGASIQYVVMADSNIRSLGGQAATRLSDGDQQVANLAILMALSCAPQNRFATLLLDDPCSDMDAETIESWAGAPMNFTENRQLIVLTHDEHLASELAGSGAHRIDVSGWESGVLGNHRVI